MDQNRKKNKNESSTVKWAQSKQNRNLLTAQEIVQLQDATQYTIL